MVLTTPTGVQKSKISNRLIGNQQSNLSTNGLLIDEQGLLLVEVQHVLVLKLQKSAID